MYNIQVSVERKAHELNGVKVSPALEYVLWEVPWMKRLYNVTRERARSIVRLVYNGYDRLPGRPHYSELSWTNETVFDHIGSAATEASSV